MLFHMDRSKWIFDDSLQISVFISTEYQYFYFEKFNFIIDLIFIPLIDLNYRFFSFYLSH